MKNFQLGDFIFRNFLNILIVFLLILNLLPILAPIFAHLGFNLPAKIIYFIYSFLCHQLHWRSLHIYDYQCAWCTRDMFLWGSILLAAILVKKFNIKGLQWFWMIPFTLPIALDGGIQTVATLFGFGSGQPVYMSTNFLRMLTGSIFGTGVGLWLLPAFKNNTKQNLAALRNLTNLSALKATLKVALVVIFTLFIIYLIFIIIWQLTSTQYPPENVMDLAVRTPAELKDWLVRRAHGI